jgi:2-polyprenyl-3-methyl-5-hydroxy-6-metoxy-1,4-benzoquinol methylase
MDEVMPSTKESIASRTFADLSLIESHASLWRNLELYSQVYRSLDPKALAEKARDWSFFEQAVKKHTSWYGMYLGDFAKRLKGKRVLELGFGDGLNALFMARLGATVTAVEIVESSVSALRDASQELDLDVTAVRGDILELNFNPDFAPFDFVVGKAFLHHLDPGQELKYLEKCASLLTVEGEARFVEPAVNSRLIDELRWLIPVPGRPSVLQRQRFAAWKEEDPHPERDNSSSHFSEVCGRYFSTVQVTPYGGIERLRRFAPNRATGEGFAAWALRTEPLVLPASIRRAIARTQSIVCTSPLRHNR